MSIVSNASPLIYLARIGRLELLHELYAELLLMDESLGRETARHLGLQFIGIIGILIEAKHTGLIEAIKPLLDALRETSGFRIRQALYVRVLQDTGEF